MRNCYNESQIVLPAKNTVFGGCSAMGERVTGAHRSPPIAAVFYASLACNTPRCTGPVLPDKG